MLPVSAWKHRFSSQCLSVIHDQAFGARTPSYKSIQELDKKVRDFYVPPSLQVPGFGGSKIGIEVEQSSVERTMQRYVAFAIKEISTWSKSCIARASSTVFNIGQLYSICIEVSSHELWRTNPLTPWAASTRRLYWRHTVVHAPSSV